MPLAANLTLHLLRYVHKLKQHNISASSTIWRTGKLFVKACIEAASSLLAPHLYGKVYMEPKSLILCPLHHPKCVVLHHLKSYSIIEGYVQYTIIYKISAMGNKKNRRNLLIGMYSTEEKGSNNKTVILH